MKYFLDCEFLEDGRRLDLISIGIVCEDGREFYAINHDAPWARICSDKWMRANVVPHLPIVITKVETPSGLGLLRWHRGESQHWFRNPKDIGSALREFVTGEDIEFWAYYGDYDWVATCRLFGRMIDLPPGWPKFCYDLRQWLNHKGLKHVRQPDEDPHHHALYDARWGADTYKFYSSMAGYREQV